MLSESEVTDFGINYAFVPQLGCLRGAYPRIRLNGDTRVEMGKGIFSEELDIQLLYPEV